MQAWLLPGYTGIPSLRLGDVPEPVAGPGQVILQVHYAALNPADAYLAVGQYPALPVFPHILGRDGVGTVVDAPEWQKIIPVANSVKEISQNAANQQNRAKKSGELTENNDGIKVGDVRLILRSEIGVTRPGTLAQRVAVDAAATVPVPEGWSIEQAAGAPLVYVTAWQALTQWGELPAQAVVLVTGASGGVGVAAVSLAHAMGYRIAALSRSAAKRARLLELGATWVYDPADPAWREQLKTDLGNSRVDLALDNIGGETFNRVLDVMAMNGRISVVGRLAGKVPQFNTAALFFRRLKIGGVAVGTYTTPESHAAWNHVLSTLARTHAVPLIDHIYDFAEVPAAFARLAAGPMGKVLVRVNACP